jgi:hypothetical protein
VDAFTVGQDDQNEGDNNATDVNFNTFLFKDGFEDIIVIKSSNGKYLADFSRDAPASPGSKPYPYAVGVDSEGRTNLWVHLRSMEGRTQVRVSYKPEGSPAWQVGEWLDVVASEMLLDW